MGYFWILVLIAGSAGKKPAPADAPAQLITVETYASYRPSTAERGRFVRDCRASIHGEVTFTGIDDMICRSDIVSCADPLREPRLAKDGTYHCIKDAPQ